ncbi:MULTISPECIES: TlpA family protein disulfide reductase [Brevibacillus]|jgi:thiol-disulfide isomerase/thioredoxin|nr:TlpA disulfide reductase family protein [Brevibacillus borstelensis]MBE5394994.1 TlpA family protein disulfide reductase [Brevibacillus borstelensis]MCC0563780.1 TlpA family protein disulfide reductase [Brevibacillus borstelensis]MCM3469521.1 TlpA family protein disulfide reductase [Brevibacillus borstelensis]MCM3559216.1 TlpA family protein disulfide reductase [Brevibacillus borstelensis]MCM3589347.1 TlpA family protein disulfide reductase [Brevibacillus borstelensis]
MKRLILAMVIAVLVGAAIWQPSQQTGAVTVEQRPEAGFEAPHFSLRGLDDQTYEVAGKREKPLVINFWASWCGPCKLEAPDLQKVAEKYGQQVDFYGVNVTSNDSLEGAQAFVKQYKLTFPIPMDVTGDVANRYWIQAFPTTYLVDKQGIIRKKIIGMVEGHYLETELKRLLEGKTGPLR